LSRYERADATYGKSLVLSSAKTGRREGKNSSRLFNDR